MQRPKLMALILLAGGIIVAAFILFRAQPVSAAQLALRSDPFPLAVGRTTLMLTLKDGSGSPISDAAITVTGENGHSGTLPVVGTAIVQQDGEYQFRLVWPSMGPWLVSVAATIPGSDEVIADQYKVYIYPISPNLGTLNSAFQSAKTTEELISANSSREMWVVIDQGTKAELSMGHDKIPLELRLNVHGQNTLVIRNDDIAAHSVGPFFVRPGETIRQEFTEPAEFVGFCSISRTGSINIIVEG
ncbi:MAG: FixH family protein [Chloroflexi bacterium]|nr:FixH family protein [Chloroflexota bacterium]